MGGGASRSSHYDKDEETNLQQLGRLLQQKGFDINRPIQGVNTWLHLAVLHNHLKLVQLLADSKANLNAKGKESQNTPLHHAAHNGSLFIVEHLLSRGANGNARNVHGTTPAHCAASKGHLKVLLLLAASEAHVDKKNKAARTPLTIAAREGQLEVVKFLLALGADYNTTDEDGKTPLSYTESHGYPEIVKVLKDHISGRPAGMRGRTVSTALSCYSCYEDDYVKLVQELATQWDSDYNRPLPMKGGTWLHFAASKGLLKLARFLVENKADVHARDNLKNTPLHLAASQGSVDMCQMLVASGAVPDVFNASGTTPLAVAAKNGHVPTVQYLKSTIAKTGAIDLEGNLTASLAATGGHAEVELLRQHASKNSTGLQAVGHFLRDVSAHGQLQQRPATPNGHHTPPPDDPLSVDPQKEPAVASYDLFLLHDRALDKQGRDQHKRVALINDILRELGFSTWFDEDRMAGHVRQNTFSGIDGSRAVLVFLTPRYMDKVDRWGLIKDTSAGPSATSQIHPFGASMSQVLSDWDLGAGGSVYLPTSPGASMSAGELQAYLRTSQASSARTPGASIESWASFGASMGSQSPGQASDTRTPRASDGDDDDGFEAELSYAFARKTAKAMIPIVMKEELLKTTKWRGTILECLGMQPAVPMLGATDMTGSVPELVALLADMGVHPSGNKHARQRE